MSTVTTQKHPKTPVDGPATVPPGYKRTEVGVIPEDWDIDVIINHASITTGNKNTQDKVDDGVYPFFVRSSTIERINSFSFDGEAVLTAGDGVGTGKIYHYINGKFDFHQRVYKISNFAKGLTGYFFYLYFSNNFYSRIMSMTAKSSVDSVRREMIADMNIPLPSPPEQRAIAGALSDVDGLISALDKQIAKKRAIKQAAMQQLLAGKTRLPGFSENWEITTLRAIASVSKGSGLSKSVIGASGSRKCVLYGELFTIYGSHIYEVITRTDSEDGRLSHAGDVLMPGSTTTIGADLAKACALMEDNVAIGGDINIIRPYFNNRVCSVFFADYLTEVKKAEITKRTQGITIIHLYGRDLLDLELLLPPVLEQRAIATVLSDMDAEINTLERRRDKTKAIKQGMMQELLTGRIRLVNNRAKA